MEIVWSSEKNRKLKETRKVSFEEEIEVLLDKGYLAVLENPSHPGQMIFLVELNDFTCVVPFEMEGELIVLKAIFPSRKFHRLYAEKKCEGKA